MEQMDALKSAGEKPTENPKEAEVVCNTASGIGDGSTIESLGKFEALDCRSAHMFSCERYMWNEKPGQLYRINFTMKVK